jgi:Chaperone of endosialidase
MKPNTLSLVSFALLIYFASSLGVEAVIPAPDGGYPGFNTAEGQKALFSLTTGAGNTAVGSFSLFSNTDGSFNTGVDAGTLLFNVGDQTTGEGVENTAVGTAALLSNTTGGDNTAVGAVALLNNTTGNGNTAIGGDAGLYVITANGVTCLGSAAFGADVNDTTWIANVYGTTTQNGTTAPVIVSAGGQLGTVASSERFKKDIATMEKASEAIMSLRPVTFRYKTDTKGTPQFGLIAEEVAKVNPALVLPDKEGKPYSVRYDQVNAMLLNEFLKEHRKVQELEADAARQQKQIDALTVGLQKMSAQLEASKPAPQVVNNP